MSSRGKKLFHDPRETSSWSCIKVVYETKKIIFTRQPLNFCLMSAWTFFYIVGSKLSEKIILAKIPLSRDATVRINEISHHRSNKYKT